MVTYAFSASLIAVDKCGVWNPPFGGLIIEFLAVWVVCLDSGGDFLIDGGLYCYRDMTHFRGDLSDVLHDGKNVLEKGLELLRGIYSLLLLGGGGEETGYV